MFPLLVLITSTVVVVLGSRSSSIRSREYTIIKGYMYNEILQQTTLPVDSIAECMVECSNKEDSCFFANFDVTSKICSTGDHANPTLVASTGKIAIKAFMCPNLVKPAHSTATSGRPTGNLPSSTVEFTCDTSYSLTLDNPSDTTQTLTCTTAGTWDIDIRPCLRKYCDCFGIQNAGSNTSDVYTVYAPENSLTPISVYCDMETDGGGWLVFQRRTSGGEDFYRDWLDYKHGFGNLKTEFWLGNENLYKILNTCGKIHELRLDLISSQNVTGYAKYYTFNITSENDMYRLLVGSYHGDAGDALAYHNNMRFTTYDKDNDQNSLNCAEYHTGAWWYKSCHYSNLNGRNNLKWHGFDSNCKFTEMKIRPKQIAN